MLHMQYKKRAVLLGTAQKTAFRHFDHVHEILHGIEAEAGAIQPSETSRIIITLKPTAKKIVPMFECFPSDISGISSSTTT